MHLCNRQRDLPHLLPNTRDELVGESGISEHCRKQRTLERNAFDLIRNKQAMQVYQWSIKGIICLISDSKHKASLFI